VQGICHETAQMAKLPMYTVGGTVHVIVNNQLGFTTPATLGRSSTYSGDAMKMINAPTMIVNAESPEV